MSILTTLVLVQWGWSLLLVSAIRSPLLDTMDEGDLAAVKFRLEDEKSKRLLLQNDMEALMLKMAKMERQYGLSDTG